MRARGNKCWTLNQKSVRVASPGRTPRTRAPHPPHPLARPVERAPGPIRVLGLSTTGGPGVFGVTVSFVVLAVVSFLTRDTGDKVEEFLALAHKEQDD